VIPKDCERLAEGDSRRHPRRDQVRRRRSRPDEIEAPAPGGGLRGAQRLDFVAEQSADFSAVQTLRAARLEVLAVAEMAADIPDSDVMELARKQGRVPLTED
jgi:Domain of unknown function (DUF5615)